MEDLLFGKARVLHKPPNSLSNADAGRVEARTKPAASKTVKSFVVSCFILFGKAGDQKRLPVSAPGTQRRLL
jgi:hypothetical protein